MASSLTLFSTTNAFPTFQPRDYVNLGRPIAMRSATVKESSRQPARRGGNVQRSKSAVADFESEAGYLYMEIPMSNVIVMYIMYFTI